MFINDIFGDNNKKLDEVSNELLGRYKKAAGADATAADQRGNTEQGNKRFKGIVKATIKQGNNDAKRHKQQGMAEGSMIDDLLDAPGKVLRTAQDAARGMPTGTVPDSQDDLVNTATKIGKQVIDTATDAARGMPTGTVPKPQKDKDVKEQTGNVPQGWEAKTQADGSTRISKIGSIPSDVYKQNMADYKAKNWTPEKMADYGQRMASGQGYTDAERSANYQQQQKSFGQYADTPLDEQGMAEGIGRGEYSRVLTALGLYYPRLSMEELNVPGFHKVIANKADVPVEYAAQVINDFIKANEPDDDEEEEYPYYYKDVSEARNGDTNFGSTVTHGSWVVYNGSKVKRFKSREGAKAYAEKNGGKVASSEHYADKIQKQGVAEGKKPDNYHIVNKDGKPASLASYADRASAEKDRDAKHPGAEVRQVGPRGKVKSVTEGTKCNMTEEGRACPEHDILECPGYSRLMGEAFKMPPESVQDRMHRRHQELRKKSGLPDPEHYLKLKKQKEQELAVLRAEIAADKEKGLTEERYLEELQRAGYDVITEKKIRQRLDPSCWKGYKKQGTKIKGGVRVNNCVPKK